MDKKIDIRLKRSRFVGFTIASLFIAGCASQPATTPDAPPAADSQALSEDVIDTADLAAYYPFSGSARDSSGNGNHGTVEGGGFVADKSGNPSSAYGLNGADAYITVQGRKSLDVAYDVSMSVWIYHTEQASEQEWYTIIEKSDPERWGHAKYGLWLIKDKAELCIQPYDLEIPHRCIHSAQPLERDQWHHLVGTSDGANLRMFINGELSTEQNFGELSTEQNFGERLDTSRSDYELYIGADQYDASPVYFNGVIDEIRVYRRVISDAEVQTLYQSY